MRRVTFFQRSAAEVDNVTTAAAVDEIRVDGNPSSRECQFIITSDSESVTFSASLIGRLFTAVRREDLNALNASLMSGGSDSVAAAAAAASAVPRFVVRAESATRSVLDGALASGAVVCGILIRSATTAAVACSGPDYYGYLTETLSLTLVTLPRWFANGRTTIVGSPAVTFRATISPDTSKSTSPRFWITGLSALVSLVGSIASHQSLAPLMGLGRLSAIGRVLECTPDLDLPLHPVQVRSVLPFSPSEGDVYLTALTMNMMILLITLYLQALQAKLLPRLVPLPVPAVTLRLSAVGLASLGLSATAIFKQMDSAPTRIALAIVSVIAIIVTWTASAIVARRRVNARDEQSAFRWLPFIEPYRHKGLAPALHLPVLAVSTIALGAIAALPPMTTNASCGGAATATVAVSGVDILLLLLLRPFRLSVSFWSALCDLLLQLALAVCALYASRDINNDSAAIFVGNIFWIVAAVVIALRVCISLYRFMGATTSRARGALRGVAATDGDGNGDASSSIMSLLGRTRRRGVDEGPTLYIDRFREGPSEGNAVPARNTHPDETSVVEMCVLDAPTEPKDISECDDAKVDGGVSKQATKGDDDEEALLEALLSRARSRPRLTKLIDVLGTTEDDVDLTTTDESQSYSPPPPVTTTGFTPPPQPQVHTRPDYYWSGPLRRVASLSHPAESQGPAVPSSPPASTTETTTSAANSAVDDEAHLPYDTFVGPRVVASAAVVAPSRHAHLQPSKAAGAMMTAAERSLPPTMATASRIADAPLADLPKPPLGAVLIAAAGVGGTDAVAEVWDGSSSAAAPQPVTPVALQRLSPPEPSTPLRRVRFATEGGDAARSTTPGQQAGSPDAIRARDAIPSAFKHRTVGATTIGTVAEARCTDVSHLQDRPEFEPPALASAGEPGSTASRDLPTLPANLADLL
jgi:hypothetical protein